MSNAATDLDAHDFVRVTEAHQDERLARFFDKPGSGEWFVRTAAEKGMSDALANFGGRKYVHVPTFLSLIFTNKAPRRELDGRTIEGRAAARAQD